MNDSAPSFWQVVNERTSVRRYKDAPVPQEILDKLKETALKAPVAGGNRNVTFQFFSDPAFIQDLATNVRDQCMERAQTIPEGAARKEFINYSANFTWFAKAPVIIAVSSRRVPSYMKLLLETDTDDLFGGRVSAAMATQNLCLAATALGLGTCCLTGPIVAREWLQKHLGCPMSNNVIMLLTLGYPAKESSKERPDQ